VSRHTIPNAPGSPEGRETTVGWDPPLATFFAMAMDPPTSSDPDDDPIEVFWHGCTPYELPTIGDLARALARHGVELPVGIARQLAEDHAAEGQRFAGRPATRMVAAMSAAYAGPEQAERISAALTGQDLKDGAR
jgi:hypothetical protein